MVCLRVRYSFIFHVDGVKVIVYTARYINVKNFASIGSVPYVACPASSVCVHRR